MQIIEARNLPNSITRPFCQLFLETARGNTIQSIELGVTDEKTADNPVFNQRFQFDVYND